MIRPLRQYHRRIVMTLGVFLPIAFAVGIAARKPMPLLVELPGSLALSSQRFESVAWEAGRIFTKTPTELHLLRERRPPGRLAISLSATRDFVKPDLLVYWLAGNPRVAGAVPGNATLLGGFCSSVLLLPPETATNDGVLVLYSLADNEIVDVSSPARFNHPTQ